MATQLQIRRGTSSQVAAFTGAEGEIVVNTTNDSVHVNDGSTAGGFELARVDGSNWAITNNISTTANISFGDNDKAIFGAGSDLQIYHDSSDSIIDDNGTGSLKLQQGGSTKLEILSTGIDVTGTVVSDGLTVEASEVDIFLYENDRANNNTLLRHSADNFRILSVDDDGSSNLKSRILVEQDTGDISFYEDTGTTPKLFWDASAESLGIGTSSPARTLSLEGTDGRLVRLSHSSNPKIEFVDTTDGTSGAYLGSEDNELVFETNGQNERMRIDSSGNVGIDVVPESWFSSYSALQIGASGALSAITSGNENVGLSSNTYLATDGNFKYIATNEATRYLQSAGVHYWYSAASGTADTNVSFSQNMTLDASGNLFLGTTSPLLNSRANFVRASTTSSSIVVNVHNSAATSGTKAANAILRVASQGNGADANIQITDSVANNYLFGGNNAGAYVMTNTNGVRLANGGTSWASDSDERVKDIIEPIENGLEKLSTLRTVIGKYKTDEEDTRRVFLIAQDVQAVLPEAVFENEGTLMLQYTDIIPLCIKAIQEQQATITALEARITQLENN